MRRHGCILIPRPRTVAPGNLLFDIRTATYTSDSTASHPDPSDDEDYPPYWPAYEQPSPPRPNSQPSATLPPINSPSGLPPNSNGTHSAAEFQNYPQPRRAMWRPTHSPRHAQSRTHVAIRRQQPRHCQRQPPHTRLPPKSSTNLPPHPATDRPTPLPQYAAHDRRPQNSQRHHDTQTTSPTAPHP